ncbi:monovalent cation/H(+) antiporter subunit G [Pelagibacterium sp. 26DY04]|uniref:monovalent cation/H(+) antiporter subunit G n=1 Tax=unclassified Pelagibacterium TaxID=2623280 RepID=UPI0028168A61|nr:MULTISPECIES: monovalent cation/H(+) antiporter subunit G [unclassified Pelagibacterium]WMT87984.1 monovalent cation/H(+) antiporter subunit G [Pelagibacterium sp. 26DY04]WMT91249.1 monovalent cation/H(+) antiporter subunit G [Pelagibacterium sp. H642]
MIVEGLYYLAGIMLIVGAIFSFLAAFGIVRLPDLYTRMHSASKAGAVGSGLALLAIALVSFDGAVILRALLGIVFFMLTAPISAHLLARAAYIAGYRPSAGFSVDELEKSGELPSK